MTTDRPNTVKATETSITILETLHELGEAGVTEIATELGYSKGNVHKHLTTLEQAEFVVRNDGVYSLSYRLLELGKQMQRTSPAGEHVVPLLESVAESVGDTVFYGVEEHGKIVYLSVARRADSVGPAIEGCRRSLDETAGGQIVLTFRDGDRRESETLLSEGVRRRIYDTEIAIQTTDEEFSEIAVPVRRGNEELIGVVGLFTPPQEHDELANEYQRLLQSTSERIAKRIAWNRTGSFTDSEQL
jgi:DNA-binding IclR family transcriptional regulator